MTSMNAGESKKPDGDSGGFVAANSGHQNGFGFRSLSLHAELVRQFAVAGGGDGVVLAL